MTTLAPGTAFGPYQILEPLGRGGMATVYKAYEAGLDRHVALKILPSEFLHDEGFAERFRREAKVIARLEHPNIIPIHNFGIEEQSHTPWMAMRLVSGGALSGVMKKARMSTDRVVAILRGVAEALDYAHGKGVIHRDIKPQNILLDEAERVYLADFGIAKMVEGSSGLTATGMISGTPQYMAPEQAMAGTVDNRADIYALGIVAYEMLTGRVPFAADTPVAVLMKHVQDPIPIPSPRDVPEPLTRALLKALAKRPEDRWPTAVAFVKALGDALGQVSTVKEMPGAAPTGFLPTEPGVSPPWARPGTPARGTGTPRAGTTSPGAPYPQTPGSGTAYPQAVGAQYPPPPPLGTGGYPQPTPPPGGYPTAYPGTPPPYPTGGYAYATSPPAPAPGGLGRGIVLALVASVGLLGVLATAALILFLRPRSVEAPQRPPVTLRSPAQADGGAVTTVPVAPPTTLAAAPMTTLPPVAPVTAAPAVPTPRPVPSPRRAAAATLPPAEEAEPEPEPPAPQPAVVEPPRAVRPAFAGAGKVEMGAKFFEKALTYEVGQPLPFEGRVGPLKVPVVQFSVVPSRRRFGGTDDQHLEVRAVFPTIDCPAGAGKWDFKMIVELMDETGRRLERLDDGGSCQNETKTVAATKPVVKALVPMIRGVRIRLEAAKD